MLLLPHGEALLEQPAAHAAGLRGAHSGDDRTRLGHSAMRVAKCVAASHVPITQMLIRSHRSAKLVPERSVGRVRARGWRGIENRRWNVKRPCSSCTDMQAEVDERSVHGCCALLKTRAGGNETNLMVYSRSTSSHRRDGHQSRSDQCHFPFDARRLCVQPCSV